MVILYKTTPELRTPLQSGQLDGSQWCPQYRGSAVLRISCALYFRGMETPCVLEFHCFLGARSFTDSPYGNPNKTVHLSNVECTGTEDTLSDCDAVHIAPGEGSDLYKVVDVVGVSCVAESNPGGTSGLQDNTSSTVIVLVIESVFLVLGLVASIRYCGLISCKF